MGKDVEAQQFFEEAAKGLEQVSAAMFYNDQQPDTIFYQGLALQRLDKQVEAEKKFSQLIDFGTIHQNDKIQIDYFAVSLPDLLIWEDDLDVRNYQLCQYLLALGNLGIGNKFKAQQAIEEVLNIDQTHIGAIVAKSLNESILTE